MVFARANDADKLTQLQQGKMIDYTLIDFYINYCVSKSDILLFYFEVKSANSLKI